MPAPSRSYEPISDDDLNRLVRTARSDREDFFARKPRYSELANRIVCVALCLGAALHLISGRNGIKDFDVWTFYDAHPEDPPFPWRRRKTYDFGSPKFGQSPDKPGFVGCHVDLHGRSLDTGGEEDPAIILRGYLAGGRTQTARRLSEKPVVLLAPAAQLGTVVWTGERRFYSARKP